MTSGKLNGIIPFLTETIGTMPMIQVRRPRMNIETILEARSVCSMMTENVLILLTNLSSLPVHVELPGLCSQFSTQRMFTGDIIQRVQFWYLISVQEKFISARNHNIFDKLCVSPNVRALGSLCLLTQQLSSHPRT